ncbi:MAG: hypothetical protein B7Z26_09150, partial [Asticcacaulis sp. 32-58-5]
MGNFDRGDNKMPGLTNWSPILPETVWSKVASALRQELGDGPYNSYVAPSALRVTTDAEPVLVTPTVYARDWFQRNALRRIHELWAQFDPEGRVLDLQSRIDFETMERQRQAQKSLSETLDVAKSVSRSESDMPLSSVKSSDPAIMADTGVAKSGDVPASDVASESVSGFAQAQALSQARADLTRIAGLQDRLTFDTFVAGRGNEFAYTMSRQVAGWGDGHFNPVFFHGPYGYGKTHLLNAIAWEAKVRRPDAKIVYLTAEKFTNTFVKAVMDRSQSVFKEDIRSADLLLIDDVHFIGGKTSSQEELFHTLTALIEKNRRIVFTADRPPTQLTEIEARLRSHLSSGLVCALDVADQALRIGIIERKLEQLSRRLGLSRMPHLEVLQFIADSVPGSIRELEGA